ncbi:MAG: ABC transporter ATP-binding protein [Fimbriimonas ginsengisoli]|uniref:ABC transporter ATP-binding protein n=1 Tax=Fimbriimonas ginsengisoli TaxID=1005039 RepID=A0A931LSP8_FIMGI|nr:ABC transporter ATP-binding protein [Fimbriimonas ginsengisoli]MBI3721510.1 ABC transporter ATP-binding protein [Fimbriimonas ginsengisoli]
MSLLEMRKGTIHFGGLVAVSEATFAIEKGDLFGLIGPNGAGKTTCFNMITGVYRPTSGSVYFKGKQITGTPPNRVAALGIARTFQNIRLFPALSVLENVVVGGFLRHRTGLASALIYLPSAIAETDRLRAEAMDLIRILDLEDVADVRSADLPYGKQRRLEIARAMATQPELLLLDEPAAGMNPQESEDLLRTVRRLRDDFGKTILLIEHDMRFVMNLCEKIFVLDHGEEIAFGPPEKIRNDPGVIQAYLGEAV